jgi:hypothetical protein
MHGKFPRNLEEKLVNSKQSHRWLKLRDVKRETESTVVAAEDQEISTKGTVNAGHVKNKEKLLIT